MKSHLILATKKLSAAAIALSITMTSAPLAQTASDSNTLHVVLGARTDVLDPNVTTANATYVIAHMIYETLFSVDENGVFMPDMVDTYTISHDGMVYDFTLRDGLKFSDGADVTPEDVLASLNRWSQSDPLGGRLAARTKAWTVTGDKSFRLELSDEFGLVLPALGKPGAYVPAIMPARIASMTPPREAVSEVIGSGPYVFVSDEWNPGQIAVLERNPYYVPRDEPGSGMGGGKITHFERIELHDIPDIATQVAALQAGEVDYLQTIPADFHSIINANPETEVIHYEGIGRKFLAAVINHRNPPFSDVKVRRAMQALQIQEKFSAALGVPPESFQECLSMFMCDTVYENEGGYDLLPEPGIETAKKLLAASSYNGEVVRILVATHNHDLNAGGQVLAAMMEEAGFNVEVIGGDWPTISKMRWNTAPVEEGGWGIVLVGWLGMTINSPLTHYVIDSNCKDAYPGHVCDERVPPLLKAFEEELDLEKRKEIATQVQAIAIEDVQALLLTSYSQSSAIRTDINGRPDGVVPVFWNLSRE